MIEITVIIPFYDNFVLLKRSINSVLKQTFKKYELIVIYDNPVDRKNLVNLKRFIQKKKKIKLIINKKNIGAGYSRNSGIKIANGKYIAFLDSDDVWKSNKLLVQYNFMKENKILASHTSYDIVDIKNTFIQKRRAFDLNYYKLLNSCDVGLSTVMLNHKILKMKTVFPNLKTKEDYVLWLKISKKGIIFNSINKTLTKWTRRSNSLSTSAYQKIKDAFTVYNKYQGFGFVKTFSRVIILSINFLKKK